MNTITSKEIILSVGKEIIMKSGIQGLNIRGVASQCGISVGSVYNYFPSKSDLIVATIGSVWKEIMHDPQGDGPQHNFVAYVLFIYNNIQKGCKRYPSFFTAHSMSVVNLDKNKGREAMDQYFIHIKSKLLESLRGDRGVRKGVFSDRFTEPDFVNFVFSNIITLLMNEADSCDFLLEVVKRTIY